MAKNKLGMAITGLGMATEAVKNATNMAELPENNYQESVDDLNIRDFNTGSYDDLANLINSTSLAKTNYNRSDVLGMTTSTCDEMINMKEMNQLAVDCLSSTSFFTEDETVFPPQEAKDLSKMTLVRRFSRGKPMKADDKLSFWGIAV